MFVSKALESKQKGMTTIFLPLTHSLTHSLSAVVCSSFLPHTHKHTSIQPHIHTSIHPYIHTYIHTHLCQVIPWQSALRRRCPAEQTYCSAEQTYCSVEQTCCLSCFDTARLPCVFSLLACMHITRVHLRVYVCMYVRVCVCAYVCTYPPWQ